jgi:SAM-dependent methyltransferase
MREHTVNPNKALWEKGDFTQIASTMRKSGAEFVGTLGITPDLAVMDLGSGDGTTAIPAAQLGAKVRGVDIARNLVAAGNARAKALGLANVTFEEGDAIDLANVPDDSVDLVVSVFGAMFAPRPNDVAKSMVRVTKPGGRIVMGNWIPGDPTLVAQILKISSAYTPPPPEGFVSPLLWGTESAVTERFVGAGLPAEAVSFERNSFTFELDRPPSELVRIFREYYGPTMNAFDAARSNGRADDLQRELETLFAAQNTTGRADTTSISATFLRVTVQT